MLKRLATTLVVLAVVAGSVFAEAKNGGIARQISMGGSQYGNGLILNPFLFDDPANIFVNPAFQAKYQDYGWMNIGGGTLKQFNGASSIADDGYGMQSAGIAFAFNREWTFGAILSFDPSAVNSLGQLISTSGISQRTAAPLQTIPGVANVWQVLAAYDMGSIDLGFSFMYGSSNLDSTYTGPNGTPTFNSEASASMIGFNAGANVDLGSGNEWSLSAGLRLDKATDKLARTPAPTVLNDGEYSASATEIQFATRLKMKMSNKFNFVPYGVVAIVSAEPKEESKPTAAAAGTTESYKANALTFGVGVGGEYHTPSFLFAGGVSFQYAKAKTERSTGGTTPSSGTTTYTAMGIPVFNLGGEWWFTDWLAGRAGYYRNLANAKIKIEGTGGGVSVSSEGNHSIPSSVIAIGGLGNGNNDALLTLGLGFRFGGFAMDATVSEEALRRGLGLIGSSDNISTFGYITTSYNFGD